MKSLHLLSRPEQVAEHIRHEIFARTWVEMMPGSDALAKELGVNHKHVEAAFVQLEREGLLIGQGPRRRRLIAPSGDSGSKPALRIGILCFDRADRKRDYLIDLQHRLQLEGYVVTISPRSICELHADVNSILQVMRGCTSDAWIVIAPGRELSEALCELPFPVFAFAGRAKGLPMPWVAPGKVPAMREAVGKMVELGHRRIVLFTRETRRQPKPGHFEEEFLKELQQHGIKTGSYNLPAWVETAEGFQDGLDSLFKVTPPTAIILDESEFLAGFFQFCCRAKLTVPGNLSLLCLDNSPEFAWSHPQITHLEWDSKPLIHRIVLWAYNVSHNKEDLLQSPIPSKLIAGGSITKVAGA